MNAAAAPTSEELARQTTHRNLAPAARAIYDLVSQSTGDLGGVARQIWRAVADGRIADGEADYLRGLIERRRADARRTIHIEAAAKPTTISKVEIFSARAWARATLFAAGEMTLHNAVDELQQYAVFLSQLWPQERESIDVLGEWFGYIISGRLDLHKILLMVGPTRGGKGAIARVLTALIGKQNVAGPTLNSLGGDFGLAPLIGKPLAIISDARFVGKNSNIVVERLLSISGEDTLTVNRKYRDQWTGKLPSRLHVISNELPRLGDASTAVVGRIILLLLSRSWLGKEDHELEQRLRLELPGILNWALLGLERLTLANENRFTRLASAEEAITAMRDLASPVAAFVREKCKVDATKEVEVDLLYGAYKAWCEDNEHTKASKQMFGRDLRAAVASVRKTRPRDEKGRHQVYAGISLNEPPGHRGHSDQAMYAPPGGLDA
jgi:P4 family phage/plasmid primase-like protien